MLVVLVWLTLHLASDTTSAPENWENTRNWKIYALNNSTKVFTISADNIRALKGVPLGDDSMHILLENSKILHVPASPAWMGCYLLSCENEKGLVMKIVVSQYGGFFLNSYDGNFYQLDLSSTRPWLEYMRRAYVKTE